MTDEEKLRGFIQEQGMTQAELSRRLGYKQPGYIAKVLAGQVSVSGNLKWRFSQAFGAEVAENVFSETAQDAPVGL